MKKWKWTGIFLAAVAVLMFSVPVDAAQKHFVAQVYKQDMNKFGTQGQLSATYEVKTGITYKVLAKNSNTAETILSGSGFGIATTAKTNPVTTTVYAADGGRIDFWCDPTDVTDDRYVDLIVIDTNGGFTAFIEDFDSYNHRIVIDETPGIVHHGVIWFGPTETATDTGINFLPKTVIHDVIVEVITTDSTRGMTVGTADTAAGFLNGVSMTTAGFIKDTAVITSGSNADYWTVSTYGTLLATAITGADTNVTTLGGRTMLFGHYVNTSGTDDDLYYAGSQGTTTAAGFIHYFFTRMR